MANGLSPGDIVKTTIVVADSEQTALLDHFWLVGIEFAGGATDQDFANQLDTAVEADVKGLMAASATYRGIMAQIINPPPVRRRAVQTVNAGNGTAGLTGLPRQTAGLISWKTAFAGRQFRGRTYMPFPATGSNQTMGIPTPSYQTSLDNLSAVLIGFNTVTGSGGSIAVTLSVFHRAFNSTTPITDSTVPLMWATQKRRGSFGKPNLPPI